MKAQTMPTVFIGHGSPLNALEENRYTRGWRQLAESLPRPRAILAISAHWYTRGTLITSGEQQRTIHDFHGFPPALYECNYPAAGSPQLARQIQEQLSPLDVKLSEDWGLDHGTWSILLKMYPEADIPVLQLSIDATRYGEFHYQLGQQLRPLRDQGVLILGSGNVVHNLGLMRWDQATPPYPWAQNFDRWIRDALVRGDHDSLIHFEHAGGDARLSVPTPEHFLPLLYIAGASDSADKVSFPTEGIELGSISMLSALYSQ
ncbi:4,5-DOPA-extradiol-dioxygenase [Microbulbifer hainanensis]|uniref:4,5-DOPA-extradiol-dioxygenase n=1 Tax=Microbulbifer hainanensis TaxID=2735675 RepID=UPI001D01DEB1|nr:4,5-DOPA dioxygenase extradiol [Microbulbifer hainanensis]